MSFFANLKNKLNWDDYLAIFLMYVVQPHSLTQRKKEKNHKRKIIKKLEFVLFRQCWRRRKISTLTHTISAKWWRWWIFYIFHTSFFSRFIFIIHMYEKFSQAMMMKAKAKKIYLLNSSSHSVVKNVYIYAAYFRRKRYVENILLYQSTCHKVLSVLNISSFLLFYRKWLKVIF